MPSLSPKTKLTQANTCYPPALATLDSLPWVTGVFADLIAELKTPRGLRRINKASPYDDIHALHAVVAIATEIPLLDERLHIAVGIARADTQHVRARCGVP